MQEELNNVRNLKIYKFLNFLLKKKTMQRSLLLCLRAIIWGRLLQAAPQRNNEETGRRSQTVCHSAVDREVWNSLKMKMGWASLCSQTPLESWGKNALVKSYHKIGKKTWWWQRGFAGSKQMEAFADMNQLDHAGDSCLHSVQQHGLYSALVPVVLG